jgi:hypothetical protein
MKLKYRDITRFKYMVTEDFSHQTSLKDCRAETSMISLDDAGLLSVRAGYLWDGPSGPTIDSKSGMRGSLVHDALYELMRRSLLESKYRGYADSLFWEIILEDGMDSFRARVWYEAVSHFAANCARFGTQPEDVICCVGRE